MFKKFKSKNVATVHAPHSEKRGGVWRNVKFVYFLYENGFGHRSVKCDNNAWIGSHEHSWYSKYISRWLRHEIELDEVPRGIPVY